MSEYEGQEYEDQKDPNNLQSQWIGKDQCKDGGPHKNLRPAIMTEDGVEYPIIVCKACGYWG